MKKCKICGETFEVWDCSPINRGTEKAFHVCQSCLESECNAGRIISCEACGEYFTADMLHDEKIEGQSFTACPHCGKDVVEGLAREQFAEEHAPDRYAVVIQGHNITRGYVVSVYSGENVIKKLAEKVSLQGVASIAVAPILLKEDMS